MNPRSRKPAVRPTQSDTSRNVQDDARSPRVDSPGPGGANERGSAGSLADCGFMDSPVMSRNPRAAPPIGRSLWSIATSLRSGDGSSGRCPDLLHSLSASVVQGEGGG